MKHYEVMAYLLAIIGILNYLTTQDIVSTSITLGLSALVYFLFRELSKRYK